MLHQENARQTKKISAYPEATRKGTYPCPRFVSSNRKSMRYKTTGNDQVKASFQVGAPKLCKTNHSIRKHNEQLQEGAQCATLVSNTVDVVALRLFFLIFPTRNFQLLFKH